MMPFLQRSFAALLIGAATTMLACAAAAADSPGRFRILYHETVDRPPLERTTAPPQPWRDAQRATRLTFEALGRRFDLDLQPNERLLRTLDPARHERLRGLELYRGSLRGKADTWVRVGILRGDLHALIWDGTELFAVEPGADVRGALASSAAHEDSLLVFRLRDVRGSFHDEVLPSPSGSLYDSLVGELRNAQAIAATQRLDIGVIGDVELYNNTVFEEDLLVRMNNVDGIFGEQVGVQINVGDMQTYTREPDPFSGANPETLLQSLGAHRLATPSQRAQGLTHLFTGRDLSGLTVGIAYLGVLCEPEAGVGLTEANYGVFFDSLTAAHEIGHNFGAPHDAERFSPCEDTPPGYLMSPEMNGSDQFSDCSLNEMAPFIAAASCLNEVTGGDASVSVTAPASVLLGAIFSTTLRVENDGPGAVHDATVVYEAGQGTEFQDMTPQRGEWNCDFTPQRISCEVGSLSAGATAQLIVTTVAIALGAHELTATLASGVDTNLANNATTRDLDVTPGAALLVSLTSDRFEAGPGDKLHLEVTVHNETTLAATGVRVDLSSHPFTMVSLTSPGASCTSLGVSDSLYRCEIGTMQAGADVSIDVTLRAPDDVDPTLPAETEFEATVDANEPLSRIRDATATAHLIAYHAKTDLAVRLVSAPNRLETLEAAHLVIALDNLGPDDVRDIVVDLSLNTSAIESLSSSKGPCQTSGFIWCTITELAAGDTVTIELDTIASRQAEPLSGQFSVRTDHILDTSASNDAVDFAIDVIDPASPTPPSDGGGGGGGGGVSIELLALMLLGLRLRMSSCNRIAYSSRCD